MTDVPRYTEAVRQANLAQTSIVESSETDRPYGVAAWGDPLNENHHTVYAAGKKLHEAVVRARAAMASTPTRPATTKIRNARMARSF